MRGIQIKIERKEVDTHNKSFIIEPSPETIERAHNNVATGARASEQVQEILEDSLYLPYDVKNPDGTRETYFVHVDDRRLFADLGKVSEDLFNTRMEKAFAEGRQHYRLEDMPKQLERVRYQAADRMQHWFAALPWWRRLFYSPAPLVEAVGDEGKEVDEQEALVEQ